MNVKDDFDDGVDNYGNVHKLIGYKDELGPITILQFLGHVSIITKIGQKIIVTLRRNRKFMFDD